MAKFDVLPCTMDDGPAVGRNNVPAFWTDSNWKALWPGRTCDYLVSQAVLRWSHTLLKEPARHRHLKAVDANTGALVGFARWKLPEGLSPDLWSEAKTPAGSTERMVEAKKNYDSADWEFDHSMDVLDGPMLEVKHRAMAGKQYLILDYLAVHPSHRNQGIASILVESGAKAADKMGLDTFVVAFKAGLNVYKRAGFQLLDQIIQDDSMYGGSGEWAVFFLAREAKRSQ